jgi:hypothetical protein
MNSIALDRIVQWLRRPRVRASVYAAVALAAIVASACAAHGRSSEIGSFASVTVTPATTPPAASDAIPRRRACGIDRTSNGRPAPAEERICS